MTFDLGGLGATAAGWGTSIITWVIILVIIFGVFIGALMFRKARKYQYPCIEIIGLGQGRLVLLTPKQVGSRREVCSLD